MLERQKPETPCQDSGGHLRFFPVQLSGICRLRTEKSDSSAGGRLVDELRDDAAKASVDCAQAGSVFRVQESMCSHCESS